MPELKIKRFSSIDFLRGTAVVLMIIFHFFYDLRIFGYNQIDFNRNPLWWLFPRIIVFLFLLSMGLSLPLVHHPHIKWHRFFKRWVVITACALGISLSTYWMFPTRWVYFGTLHCISLSSLLVLPLVGRPKLALALGLIILAPIVIPQFSWPFFSLPHKSMDYIPLLPWIGIVLVGIFLHSKNAHRLHFLPPGNRVSTSVEFLGRHSLVIYLLHQPMIYGGIWVVHRWLSSGAG